MQDGLVPPLHQEEAAGIITGSEQNLKEYAKKASLTAKDIIALIEEVLHNPDYDVVYHIVYNAASYDIVYDILHLMKYDITYMISYTISYTMC